MTHFNTNNALVFEQNTKQIIMLGMLFGAIAALTSMSLIFGLVSSVPFIYAYYMHGEKVFWTAGVFSILLVLLINLVNGNDAVGINTINSLSESVPLSTNAAELEASDSSELFISNRYIVFLLLAYSLRFLGIWTALKFSSYSWTLRLVFGMILITLGMLPLLSEARDLTFSMFQFTEVDTKLISKVMYYIVPVVTSVLLIYNWIFSTIFLSLRSKTNYNTYLEYVFNKVLAQHEKIPNIVPVVVGAGVLLTRNTEQGNLYIINIISTALLMMLALLFAINGCAYIYFYFRRKFNIRPIWYLFFVCTIIIVPLINIPILIIFLIIGLWFDWKLKTRLQRSKNESNT